jgi:hypothetical protein
MDKFMEIIKRYREGNASEEEKKLVEVEIEKNKAINELLTDEFEKDFDFDYDPGNIDETTEGNIDEIGETVKKAVDRRFRKMLMMSVIAVVLIFAVFQLVVSPVMDRLYYDPGNITQGEYFNDITFDMFAFTELNVPGYSTSSIIVSPEGYGKYDLIIRRKNLFEGDYERISMKQIRDRREGFFDYLFGYYYSLSIEDQREGVEHSYEYKISMTDLKIMDERNYISLFIILNENINLEEFVEMKQQYDLEYKWLAVEGPPYDKVYDHTIGFNPSIRDSLTGSDSPDKDDYPLFSLLDFRDYNVGEVDRFKGKSYEEDMAYFYDIHFKSLLSYLIDREEFVKMYGYNPYSYDFYKDAQEYIEEKGVGVTGILVLGNADEIIRFVESEDVYSISINDVKVSRY